MMRSERKDDIMLNLKVIRVCQILNLEELFHFMNASFCQVNDLIFLVHDKIPSLLDIFPHNGIHLCKFPTCFPAL